jgi:RNA polymerase sigma-70 factor (ECF subfamily)
METRKQEQRDRQWVREIRKSDRKAFEQLFRAYVDPLYAFAAEHVEDQSAAEDIVQDVFCDLWERRADWEPDGTVKAYLYRAVRNTALDRLDRRQVREDWKEEEKEEGRPRFGTGPADALRQDELRRALEDAVEDLPSQQKLVYRLAHRHGLSYREIASALGIARKTVENHMGRALRSLRSQLAEHASFLQ